MYDQTVITDIEKAAAMVPLSESVRGYLLHGHKVGGFLTAVFEGDLFSAATRADPDNAQALADYGRAMVWLAPYDSYGSPEKVKAWIERRGALGKAGDD